MKVAILKETYEGETRVAVTPETTKKMISMGLTVSVEEGAGLAASFSNDAYAQAGATLCKTVDATLDKAYILLKVRAPQIKNELKGLSKEAIIIATMAPYHNLDLIEACEKKHVSAIALEMIPRITRAQSMDVLSSQANLAGYRAVIDAVYEYGRALPMMMTAAGTVPPAKVLIVGAGVAGLQAIATAKRLGAVVSAFDVRAAVKEQVESLGGKFIEVDPDAESNETAAGYAKEMSEAYKKRQADKMAESVAASDIVITTALIPGKPAPRLVTKEMVSAMKPGSVLLDMGVEMGGNIEGSVPGKIIHKKGVIIIGHGNLPGRLPAEASTLYARNILNLLTLMHDKDSKKITIDLNDDILKAATLTHGGKIIHPDFMKIASPHKTSSKGDKK